MYRWGHHGNKACTNYQSNWFTCEKNENNGNLSGVSAAYFFFLSFNEMGTSLKGYITSLKGYVDTIQGGRKQRQWYNGHMKVMTNKKIVNPTMDQSLSRHISNCRLCYWIRINIFPRGHIGETHLHWFHQNQAKFLCCTKCKKTATKEKHCHGYQVTRKMRLQGFLVGQIPIPTRTIP